MEQPIRVVLFGSGPTLERGPGLFIRRLIDCPEVEFLGAYCQSEAQGGFAVLKDLWRRRGLLALPLLLAQVAGFVRHLLREGSEEAELNRAIKRVGQRIHFVPDIHADSVLREVRALSPDLGLIYGSPILKPKLFQVPSKGTLGIHHGTLPAYRGKKTTFWEMYNGEAAVGVAIQQVNAGLDAGDIVGQGKVLVGHRSIGPVWSELEALGLDLYMQAILDVKRGTVCPRPQTGARGNIYRDPQLADLLRFWYRHVATRLGGP